MLLRKKLIKLLDTEKNTILKQNHKNPTLLCLGKKKDGMSFSFEGLDYASFISFASLPAKNFKTDIPGRSLGVDYQTTNPNKYLSDFVLMAGAPAKLVPGRLSMAEVPILKGSRSAWGTYIFIRESTSSAWGPEIYNGGVFSRGAKASQLHDYPLLRSNENINSTSPAMRPFRYER